MAASNPVARRKQAVESFGCAALALGKIEAGMSLFAITRGQWSMIDAILHCLDQVGPSKLSLWTWTAALDRFDPVTRIRTDPRVTSGRLIVKRGDAKKHSVLLGQWRETFGARSVLSLDTHAKICTIEGAGLKLLLRGSMNLGTDTRFEQFDLTEGGADFDYVRSIESGLVAEAVHRGG